MENEELAALRATLLAAQRQPSAVRARQARLSALVAEGDELLPYVLSGSCSDPRDRACRREDLGPMRVLEGGTDRPRLTRPKPVPRVEPPPARPLPLAVLLSALILLCLLGQLVGMLLLHH